MYMRTVAPLPAEIDFTPPFTRFVAACLAKDQAARPSAGALGEDGLAPV